MPKHRYEVGFQLPTFIAASFSTNDRDTVYELFGQVYQSVLDWMEQEEGEELAVIIRLEDFTLGAFILPFQEEEVTQRMREITVAEFYDLLWKDWREAFRILPANAHSKVDAFLATMKGG